MGKIRKLVQSNKVLISIDIPFLYKKDEVKNSSEMVWYDHLDRGLRVFKCSRINYEYCSFPDGLEVYFDNYGWLSGKMVPVPVEDKIEKQKLVSKEEEIINILEKYESDIVFNDHKNIIVNLNYKDIEELEEDLSDKNINYEIIQ